MPGATAEVGWQRGDRWTVAPTARLFTDTSQTSLRRAGARTIGIALGARFGRTFSMGTLRIQPQIGAFAEARAVLPQAAVGPLRCAPSTPCTLDEPEPPPASPFAALTATGEANVAVDWWPSTNAGLRVSASVLANPGHVRLSAPKVATREAMGAPVRGLPALPAWQALVQAGLRWRGP